MSRMGYLDIVNLTGLDTVISPKAIIASQISSYVRGLANSQGSAVESLHYILGGAIEAVEFTATSATHFLDRPLSDLHFRNGLLVAAIVHNGRMEIPNGHSQIHAGDRVIVVAKKALFAGPQRYSRLMCRLLAARKFHYEPKSYSQNRGRHSLYRGAFV